MAKGRGYRGAITIGGRAAGPRAAKTTATVRGGRPTYKRPRLLTVPPTTARIDRGVTASGVLLDARTRGFERPSSVPTVRRG